MGIFGFLPFLFVSFYLVVFGVIFYLVYTWVNKFIALKQEHNNLLREIIRKMDQKS
jgi:hypothetical protein